MFNNGSYRVSGNSSIIVIQQGLRLRFDNLLAARATVLEIDSRLLHARAL